MKQTPATKAKSKRVQELASEYRFDYTKSKPNRFANKTKHSTFAVVLDPDVAEVFKSGEAVNAVLRALLETMPTARTLRARAR